MRGKWVLCTYLERINKGEKKKGVKERNSKVERKRRKDDRKRE